MKSLTDQTEQNVSSIEIWHVSGGKSKLYFSNYTQQVRHLQGFELILLCLK